MVITFEERMTTTSVPASYHETYIPFIYHNDFSLFTITGYTNMLYLQFVDNFLIYSICSVLHLSHDLVILILFAFMLGTQ